MNDSLSSKSKVNSRYLVSVIILIILILSSFFYNLGSVWADELEDISKQIEELEKAKRMSEQATVPLEKEAGVLRQKVDNVKAGLASAAVNLTKLEKSIISREKDFDNQYELLSARVEKFYKQLRAPNELLFLVSSKNLIYNLKNFAYRKQVAFADKKQIENITADISQLEKDREKLKQDKESLQSLETRFNSQLAFFEKEIAGARDYQKNLGSKIAELSAKQKELLAKKTETFQTSVGSVPLADDPASRPDYNPGFAPAFAAFSFGAPHFRGMSQYGALGRSKDGQGYEQILKAYYGDVRIEKVETNFDIPTTIGNLNFEDNYLKGIAEMPTSWADENGFEALKAQAIAARSYALAYTDWRMGSRSSKKSICTTENCQVYNSGKAGNPGRWGDAVNDTRGMILVSNSSNEVVNTWYASTSGGYQESYSSLGHTTPGFWDTKSGRSGWTSQAYEKIGDSPWFYKSWYKTRGGTTCGRSHPWLSQEEFSDIVNAVILYSKDQSNQTHLSQEDSSCYGESIPDTWSKAEVRNKMDQVGGAVNSISSVAVTYADNGITASVLVNTNRGAITLDGQQFYKIFNLRAPGAIHLTSGLFNIEKK